MNNDMQTRLRQEAMEDQVLLCVGQQRHKALGRPQRRKWPRLQQLLQCFPVPCTQPCSLPAGWCRVSGIQAAQEASPVTPMGVRSPMGVVEV